ncbi:hypothetical protein Mro03_06340 [Microbispora rosea subsp. rosea]|nr:hypothetical protein Mro03_06340 [Microbispora rosea subsp. rosea]
MAEGLLDHLEVDPGGEHERGGAVAQVVQSHRRQFGLVGEQVVLIAATSRRCQASNVPGVTSRWDRSTVGSTRARAARTALSAQSGFGRTA